MAWIVQNDPELGDQVVQSPLREGCPLDFPQCPFPRWITKTTREPLTNIFDVLLLFIERLGSPLGG